MTEYGHPLKGDGIWSTIHKMSEKITGVALVLGVTGMVGLNLSRRLVEKQWKVYGISRKRADFIPKEVEYISCDLFKPEQCKDIISRCKDTTHVFYASWVEHGSEELNITGNTAMMRNLFNVEFPNLVHFVLVTGTKQYLGSFEKMKSDNEADNAQDIMTPFKESMPRPPGQNFYYQWEDMLYGEAAAKGFSWSVARPHVIAGFAPGNKGANQASNLAVYASICKHLNMPFTFPGCPEAWRNLFDVSDARLVADHLIWEATTPAARNQAFNVVNGDVFRWKDMWKVIADYFELPVGEYKGRQRMVDKTEEYSKVWDEMVVKYGLKPYKLENITGFWLTDLDLWRTVDGINDMTKSREMGFLQYKSTEKMYIEIFDELREGKYIP